MAVDARHPEIWPAVTASCAIMRQEQLVILACAALTRSFCITALALTTALARVLRLTAHLEATAGNVELHSFATMGLMKMASTARALLRRVVTRVCAVPLTVSISRNAWMAEDGELICLWIEIILFTLSGI